MLYMLNFSFIIVSYIIYNIYMIIDIWLYWFFSWVPDDIHCGVQKNQQGGQVILSCSLASSV